MPPSLASTTAKLPFICSRLRIHRDTEVARGEFRARRLGDPLRDYDIQYPTARAAADAVVDALTQLLAVPADGALLASLVGGKATQRDFHGWQAAGMPPQWSLKPPSWLPRS